MGGRLLRAGLGLVLVLVLVAPVSAEDGAALVDRSLVVQTGDLDAMTERGRIRVLVSYSQTDFFIDNAVKRGFEYELMREYEKSLASGLGRKDRRVQLAFIPVPLDRILPALVEGRGDIAAAGLTVTDSRLELVDFTDPYLTGVSEIVVTSKSGPAIASLEDLAGRLVCVPKGSSYEKHLFQLSRELEAKGLSRIDVRYGDEDLDEEDLLELVHAGILDCTVTDGHVADLWSSTLPNLVPRHDLAIHRGGRIAWAVRKDSPKLMASLNDFVAKHRKGTLLGNIWFKRYYQSTKWVTDPTTDAAMGRLQELRPHFETYGREYGFDWLLMAAQAFQESGLDPKARSGAGAVGIMQLLPSTARDMGITRLDIPEHNIHAGVKYMDWLRRNFFDDPELSREVRVDFCLAAYNAGPGRVRAWRKKAPELGLDPNEWFDHVELIALREIGQETVRYVGNINKYYVAYKLGLESLDRKAKLREEIGNGR